MCLEFPFKIGHVKFKTKVYILERAPFQFLLGTKFLHATGRGLFPRWNTIVMTIPSRLEIKCSTEGPTRKNSLAPLQVADELEERSYGPRSAMQFYGGSTKSALAGTGPGHTGTCHVRCHRAGAKDLVSVADGFMKPADFEALTPNLSPLLRTLLYTMRSQAHQKLYSIKSQVPAVLSQQPYYSTRILAQGPGCVWPLGFGFRRTFS